MLTWSAQGARAPLENGPRGPARKGFGVLGVVAKSIFEFSETIIL